MTPDAHQGTPLDLHGRPARSLRISVTDRCNLRCAYCMPEREYIWLERSDLLSYEEIASLADAFTDVGVERARLTGGEPLLRRDLEVLIGMLAAREGLREVALTTNGVQLAGRAAGLRGAGLDRITVSLDTLRPEVFRELTRRDELAAVLAGIDDACAAGFDVVKLDTVVLRGTNDGELFDLLDFARERGIELRFIEYMDVGGATHWTPELVVSQRELLERVAARRGRPEPLPQRGSAPAQRYRLADGQVFGLIASTTAPFCGACDRSRLTADGRWFLCLYARVGLDLRGLLRGGATRAELAAVLARTWGARGDRGAEERLAEAQRGALVDVGTLRADPHLEMHTRGG
ncbi:MAG TPA: GTP 3',8-cyclase MoaA [Planctomycetota bacterium]|nr:GTP 3',8-cyclase MoaA [Planctomycetota bacterium]